MGISLIVGKTVTEIENQGDRLLIFRCLDGSVFDMYHDQDCCETVEIEEIIGDLDDLIGVPILVAEERESERKYDPDGYPESSTWTFYEFRTIKGSVTIRWLGTSNGYYSETVDFVQLV